LFQGAILAQGIELDRMSTECLAATGKKLESPKSGDE
jgi:hypothetical protein